MERSEAINELAMALSKAQGEIKPAAKDVENAFFKSKYADLAAVWDVARGPLAKNGLSVTQHPTVMDGFMIIETVVLHSSGQWMSSKLAVKPKDEAPQAVGSAITYARRYALSSIIGIASEVDDDGNAASGVSAPSAKPAVKAPIAAPVAKRPPVATPAKSTPEHQEPVNPADISWEE